MIDVCVDCVNLYNRIRREAEFTFRPSKPLRLDRALFLKLAACGWIAERRNCATEASGLGRAGSPARSATRRAREPLRSLHRMRWLFADLAIAHSDARNARLLRVKLLILGTGDPKRSPRSSARSARNHRGSLRQRLADNHQTGSRRRPLAWLDRRSHPRRRHPRPRHRQRLLHRSGRRRPS